MKTLYALLLLAVGLPACQKDPAPVYDFSRQTITDSLCQVISADSTDWTYDPVWTAFDSSTVRFADTIVITDTLTGYVNISPACPNPGNGLFIIGLDTEHACAMRVACVNTEREVIWYSARKLNGGPVITAYDFRNVTAFRPGENYRLYYAFYNHKDSMFYRGHGDISRQ